MRKKIAVSLLTACCGTLGVVYTAIAEAPAGQPVLTGNTGSIAIPGFGKVLLAFVLTLGVGVALIFLMRRALPWLPKLAGQTPPASAPRVLASRNVHAGLKLHTVDVEGVTVLIAEGKGSIAMTLLPPRPPTAPPLSDSIQP